MPSSARQRLAERRRLSSGQLPPIDTVGPQILHALDTLDGPVGSPSARAAALDALCGLQGDPVRHAVLRTLDDPHPTVRAAAIRAAVSETSLLAMELGDHPAPTLSSLQYAALTHPRAEVRHQALQALDLTTIAPLAVASLAVALRSGLTEGTLPPDAADHCLDGIAAADTATLTTIWRAWSTRPTEAASAAAPAPVTTTASSADCPRSTLLCRLAARIPWEEHYEDAARHPGRKVPPTWLSGAALASLGSAEHPDLLPIWSAWLDAIHVGDPHAHRGLDRLAGTFLALNTLPATGSLARDLLLVLRGRLARPEGPDVESTLYTVLAIVALREPGVLVCPALPTPARHAALLNLHALYPDGPQLRPADPGRRRTRFVDRLPASSARLERALLHSFASCVLPEDPHTHGRPIEQARRLLGLDPEPRDSVAGLRAAGLPIPPGGGRIHAEDLLLWSKPAPAGRGGLSPDPHGPCSARSASPPVRTVLEAWLDLMPAEHHGELVWKHVDEETLTELVRNPATANVVDRLVGAGHAASLRTLRLRQREERGTRRTAGRVARGSLRQSFEQVLRCGHREDIAAMLDAPAPLEPLAKLLPAMEALPLPARRRGFLEYAGRLLADRLDGDDEATRRLLRRLVLRFESTRDTFGVLFHVLEAIGRTRPARLAEHFVEAIHASIDGAGQRIRGWSRIDTLGEPFHRAVIARLGGPFGDLYRNFREVRVPEDAGPIALASALHRVATGAPLPFARARKSVADWVEPALVHIHVPAPGDAEARLQVQGLVLALLAALRDRLDGPRAMSLIEGADNNARGERRPAADRRATLRAEVQRRLDALLEGREDSPRGDRHLAGMRLAAAGRWAALLGRRLGRGRRVRLLAAAGGAGGVMVAEALRWLALEHARQGGEASAGLGRGLAALPVHALLRSAEDDTELAACLRGPGVPEAVLGALSRAALPGSELQVERQRTRLMAAMPAERRAELGGAVPEDVFWAWATEPSPPVRERLVAHVRSAPLARRLALAQALPWASGEMPDAAVTQALVGAAGDQRAVIDALQAGLRRLRVGAGDAHTALPRLTACLPFLEALALPAPVRQRWLLHLWRQDTRAFVANVYAPAACWYPTGIHTIAQWGEERGRIQEPLAALLAVAGMGGERRVAHVLLREAAWTEWIAAVDRWQDRKDALLDPALLGLFLPARPVRLRCTVERARQAMRQSHDVRRDEERARVRGLRRLVEHALASGQAAGGVSMPTDDGLAVRVVGILLAARSARRTEVPELLAAVLAQASPPALHRVVRLLAAVRTPLVTHPHVAMALLGRAAEGGPDLRRAVLELVRAVPSADLQAAATRALVPEEERRVALRRQAELVRWTAALGRRLTGVPTRVRFIGGDDLGFTRLDGHTIWINPVAWFEGAREGRAIVEGLIAHEIGHLALHAAPAFRRAVDRAVANGPERKHWLNIVLDEHLERNLRARDPQLGDRLKKLCAWALLHRSRRMDAAELLHRTGLDGLPGGVQAQHLDALPGALRVEARELPPPADAASRFFRTLRLGLGQRTDDPRVARGMALFRGHFRHRGASALAGCARELHRIFRETGEGGVDDLGATGSPDPSTDDPRDAMLLGGWTIVEIEDAATGSAEQVPTGRNHGETKIVIHNRQSSLIVPPFERKLVPQVDRAAEADLRSRARSLAGEVRNALAQLGRRSVQERHRPRGRRMDTGGLGQRVLLHDPRLLRRVRTTAHGDLFIGIAVDSSGSMRMLDNLSRATLFAAITAVAADGLPHVTTRLAGFTNDTLFDLGDARRTRLTALVAGGGNNDAAALDWLAAEALASRRRHRLLVMISDGRPTACSEDALAARIRHWEGQGLMLVQLALRGIEPPVFPRQVTLSARNERSAARDWCRLISELALECTA